MTTPKAGQLVQVAALSMVVKSPPPDLVGDLEYYVRLGPRGARRKLQHGDLVALDGDRAADLIELYPDSFQPAGAPPTVVVQATETDDVRHERERERLRLLPRFAEVRTPICENCLETGPPSPPIPPQVQALSVASALQQAHDDGSPEDAARVRYYAHTEPQRRTDAIAVADRNQQDFETSHVCDPTRELHPLREPPALEPGQVTVWSGPVSIRQ